MRCRLRSGFFSEHDRALHGAVFPRAYSVALVANVLEPGEETFSLFGWRNGRIEERGLHVIAAPEVTAAGPAHRAGDATSPDSSGATPSRPDRRRADDTTSTHRRNDHA